MEVGERHSGSKISDAQVSLGLDKTSLVKIIRHFGVDSLVSANVLRPSLLSNEEKLASNRPESS